ncbi:hypothetical protein GYMLUDRAFT_89144 [Collybiopsis luxurians FD-317 M1]|uniref:Uncharacterized protein n=1 Tax=Collybiopsis luxurians FD-317 M1 TaxID=944289 RepID=A0A0D0BNH5_9AGAR|nr:hypothetical protein GYMLUDRAFT_89144 [Collybiopsis luxurians FD-317 M1]
MDDRCFWDPLYYRAPCRSDLAGEDEKGFLRLSEYSSPAYEYCPTGSFPEPFPPHSPPYLSTKSQFARSASDRNGKKIAGLSPLSPEPHYTRPCIQSPLRLAMRSGADLRFTVFDMCFDLGDFRRKEITAWERGRAFPRRQTAYADFDLCVRYSSFSEAHDFSLPAWESVLQKGDIMATAHKGKVQGFFSGKEDFMDRLLEALGLEKQGTKHKLDPLGGPSAYSIEAIEAGIFALKQIIEANTQGGTEGYFQTQVNQDLEHRDKRVIIKEQALHAREASVVASEANIPAREASIATREAGIAVREKNVTAGGRNIAAREKSNAAKERHLLPEQHRNPEEMLQLHSDMN